MPGGKSDPGGTKGGSAAGRWTGIFYRYDTEADSWTELPSLRTPRRRLTLVAVPGNGGREQ